VHYGYDTAGHLRSFFDREANPALEAPTQSFTYKPGTHLLEDLRDGKGVRAARNFFDAQGRLQRTVDAQGKETVFTHDIAGRTETIIDRAGNTTLHRYDERGNVTETQMPDGTVTRTQYHTWSDGRKSDLKTSESVTGLFTNEAGQLETKSISSTYVYEDDDAATPPANDGLLRKMIDPLGYITRLGYDERGNVLTVTDPLGHTTTTTYYPDTNLVHTMTDALGHVTTMTYDARGNLDRETRTVTVVDAAGVSSLQTVVTDADYDAEGHLVKMTDAGGHITTYENDVHGNRLFERTTRTNANGQIVPVVTEHEYDANDRLVKSWDAEHPRQHASDLPTSETVYDENGKTSVVYDALRRETRMFYTTRGELERTEHADGTSESTLYDDDGRREFSINRRGKRTQTIYDNLGRVYQTVFIGSVGDTPVTLGTTIYDAAGRVYQSTDTNGHTSTSVYDVAGRRTRMIDALGHESVSEYDDAGNLRFFTDAKGRVTEHRYDDLNRRTTTIHPAAALDVNGNGVIDSGETNVVTTTSTGYDELGRRVSETDANGISKRFVYDQLGRLTDVVQPAPVSGASLVTSYAYDELGNQLTQTDAKQQTTRYSYDSIGRRLTRRLPLGQLETTQYDAAGNLRYRTDFNGRMTEYQYDPLNRLRSRIPDATFGEPTVEWRYTLNGQRERMIDGHGTTIYTYDSRDRLETKQSPEGTLTYGYDDIGNLTSMTSSNANGVAVTYRHDELNCRHRRPAARPPALQ
jgi:YD repeat-containing protein